MRCRDNVAIRGLAPAGSTLRLPEFLGAGAIPTQLQEFYEAMHLIFVQLTPLVRLRAPMSR